MRTVQQCLTTATDPGLAIVIRAAVNVKVQLRELNELGERVNKELALIGKSPPPKLPSARNLTLQC